MVKIQNTPRSSSILAAQSKPIPSQIKTPPRTQTVSTITPEKKASLCSALISKVKKLIANIQAWFRKTFYKNKKPKEPVEIKPHVKPKSDPKLKTGTTPSIPPTPPTPPTPTVIHPIAQPKKRKSVTFDQLPPSDHPPRPIFSPLDVSDGSVVNYRNSLTPKAAAKLTQITKQVSEFLADKIASPRTEGNLQTELETFEQNLDRIESVLYDYLNGFKTPLESYLALCRIKESLLERGRLFISKADAEFSDTNQTSIDNFKKAASLNLRASALALSLCKSLMKKLSASDVHFLKQDIAPLAREFDIHTMCIQILEGQLDLILRMIASKTRHAPDTHTLYATQVLFEKRLEELNAFKRDISLFKPDYFHILYGKEEYSDKIHPIHSGKFAPYERILVDGPDGQTLFLYPLYSVQMFHDSPREERKV